MAAFASHRSDPHFTVDDKHIYQHVDTSEGARALRNAPGGVETNRDSAVQIELVGFAHLPKNPKALENLARLCRWIEAVHGIPRVWPSGFPLPAKNGKDPGGHNRDPKTWDTQSGHYGHSHVPENTHWDPGYSGAEVDFIMTAEYSPDGRLISHAAPPQPKTRAGAARGQPVSTMPEHATDAEAPPMHRPGGRRATDATANGRAAAPRRIYNVRADALDFRDRMYVPSLIEVPTERTLADYLLLDVPLLDQGSEGSCTGFALATVANYLLRKRTHVPDLGRVSARMLYDLARRYDEWPGEDYSGSSARGAMKGWNKHGVCAESDYPSATGKGERAPRMDARRTDLAKRRPLGAYFRVNHKDLIAMHAAISEVGILFATATVHDGWNQVKDDGIIPQGEQVLGGHAFAIVAYDEHGFWVQNSWAGWGKGQMGRISYDDWLANGTDVWVARLGAPVTLNRPISFATAHATTSGQSSAYTYADLRPHIISVENEGRLKAGGDYGSTAEEVAAIFEEDIPRLLAQRERKRLLLYAHGGLVGEEAAVQRVSEYRPALLEAGIYPLAFAWHSDYWTSLTNMLQDAVRRRRPEGFLDKAKDFMLDRLDDMIEPLARTLTGKASWTEMKENALLASAPGGAARLIVQHIVDLQQTKGMADLEIHLVGHSAGAIFLAPMVQLLCAEGGIGSGPMRGASGHGLKIASCTLWAPACTTELFKETYFPAIQSKAIRRFTQFSLNDQTEQDDNCANIYNKSLLYLVSHAFEDEARIPGLHDGAPILGMARAVAADPALQAMFAVANAELVLAPNNDPDGSTTASKARHHGDFDDDEATVRSTFARILSAVAGKAGSQHMAETPIVFNPSAQHLAAARVAIDMQTMKSHNPLDRRP
jgi:hypothetical protein